ncbi:hypothetical protein [Methylophilus sp. YYY-1]|uniref:hypothetical protein n=1 Tax=Methylophilus sp. YYY-1 TaxID=2682087 RepID=UPI0023B2F28B|nr:hypothetical protein [Methylophilus sp. YYY-1]
MKNQLKKHLLLKRLLLKPQLLKLLLLKLLLKLHQPKLLLLKLHLLKLLLLKKLSNPDIRNLVLLGCRKADESRLFYWLRAEHLNHSGAGRYVFSGS